MPPKKEPLTVWGVVWQQAVDGSWERHLIRKTQGGRFLSDKLVRVVEDRDVCLSCLSQNTVITAEGNLACHSCGVEYGIVEAE